VVLLPVRRQRVLRDRGLPSARSRTRSLSAVRAVHEERAGRCARQRLDRGRRELRAEGTQRAPQPELHERGRQHHRIPGRRYGRALLRRPDPDLITRNVRDTGTTTMIVRNTRVAAAIAAALMLAGGAASAQDTIKVGILHSLSGTMAISETSLKDTMLMLIEEQ